MDRRRRRRLRRVRRSKGHTIRGLAVLVVFLVLGVAAIGIGYMLSSHLVAGLRTAPGSQGAASNEDFETGGGGEPSDQADEPAADPDNTTDLQTGDAGDGALLVIDGQPITLFAVQIGSFSSADNAADLAQETRAAGLPAAVVNDGGFRVWAGLYSAEGPARSLIEQVRRQGYDSFLVPWQLQASGRLPAVAGAGGLRDLVQALPSVTQQLAAVWTAMADGGRDWPALATAAHEGVIALQDQTLALAVPDELGALAVDVIGYVQRASVLAAALTALADGDLPPDAANGLMMDYIELADEVARILSSVAQPAG